MHGQTCKPATVPIDQRCAYVKTKCAAVDGNLFNFLELHYCTWAEWPEVSIGLQLGWLGLMFAVMLVACERFFCPSIERLSEALSLSPALAGATLLAFGNGATDLFTQIAMAVQGRHSDGFELALTEPLGTGMFVTNVVVACVILVTPRMRVPIHAAKFMKDCTFFAGAVLGLTLLLLRGRMEWWLAAMPAVYYTVYIVVTVLMERGQEPLHADPKRHEIPNWHSTSFLDDVYVRQMAAEVAEAHEMDVERAAAAACKSQPLATTQQAPCLGPGYDAASPFRNFANVQPTGDGSRTGNASVMGKQRALSKREMEIEGMLAKEMQREEHRHAIIAASVRGSLRDDAASLSIRDKPTTWPHGGAGAATGTGHAFGHAYGNGAANGTNGGAGTSVKKQRRHSYEVTVAVFANGSGRGAGNGNGAGGSGDDAVDPGLGVCVPDADPEDPTAARVRAWQEAQAEGVGSGRPQHAELEQPLLGQGRPHGQKQRRAARRRDWYRRRKAQPRWWVDLWRKRDEDVGSEADNSNPFTSQLSLWRLLCVPIKFLLSLTLPLITNRPGSTATLPRAKAAVLPITLPLVLAMYFFSFNPWTADWRGSATLHAATIVCVAASGLVAATWPADGALHGPPFFVSTIAAFAGSMLWMRFAAEEVVAVTVACGIIFKISSPILAATFLSWAGAAGDTVSNLALARDGFPTMALTACFSSPLFVLLGGLSCTLYLYADHTPTPTGASFITLPTSPELLVLYSSCVFVCAVWLVSMPFAFRYKLDVNTAIMALVMYGVFSIVYVAFALRGPSAIPPS
ncbi:hypothetical protein FOA52_012677 [Chlamydomonas sp. UWO 241]|nr:hypothetical protein FOA52_012677 [Chlamydomonas sp. UWO 241]